MGAVLVGFSAYRIIRRVRVHDLFSHVVRELEETQVERQFLLGNAPMRAQPTAQE